MFKSFVDSRIGLIIIGKFISRTHEQGAPFVSIKFLDIYRNISTYINFSFHAGRHFFILYGLSNLFYQENSIL